MGWAGAVHGFSLFVTVRREQIAGFRLFFYLPEAIFTDMDAIG
jgi:hypothetical protein